MDADLAAPDVTAAVVVDRLVLQLPTSLDWIGPTIELLRRRAVLSGVCDENRAGKLGLALHEALTNSIIHGNLELSSDLKEQGDAFAQELLRRTADPILSARAVTVELYDDGEVCHWTLTDQGRGFDFEARWRRLDEPTEDDLLRPSGRGLMMMRAFVDAVRYDLEGRRVRLTLRRPDWREHRRQPRLPARQGVRVAPLRPDGSVDWAAAQEAVARDLSADGVGLLVDRLTQAAQVVIGLEAEGRTVFLPAEVRHCTPGAAGLIEIGCRFRIARPEEATPETRAAVAALDRLLDGLEARQRPRAERREHPRTHYTERIEVSTAEGSTLSVFARDLSRGGIAFISSRPIEAAELTIHLPQQDGPPLRLPAQVLRCSPIAEGFYDVAARFVTE
jgi:anti-sigma regulatory factor (Ser/Thr protein kinase)